MSSDDYFEDDFDEETLEQLNAIEAALLQSPARPPIPHRAPSPINIESSDYDDTFDFDENELKDIDKQLEGFYNKPPQQQIPTRTASKGTLQTTLFGEILPREASTSRARINNQKSKSKPLVAPEPRKTKQWDHTAFAKTGIRSGKAKGKQKQRNDEDVEEEAEEFEQFPAPFISLGPSPPMKLQPDLLEAKHWIYPLNRPKRDYQFEIVQNSLFENTIVALPTGLGKTFIAGVVMLNYYRWFPEGKVIFVAPTKPLVSQQVEACHEACGIPGSDAEELTGNVGKATRSRFYATKRVFYMTPQTLMNDLQTENSGCDARDIVLLVIDEAHRATGDYAYNQVVRYMMAKNPHFRILALTATPGSNKDAVQTLIDGLHISRIEIRDERSLAHYNHDKKIEQHVIPMSPEIDRIKAPIVKYMQQIFRSVSSMWSGTPNLERMHPYAFQGRIPSLREKNQGHLFQPLQKLATFARFLGYLMEGTIKMCYDELEAYATEPEARDDMTPAEKGKATKAKKALADPLFLSIMSEIRAQHAQGFSIHPKMEKMKTLIVQHFGSRMNEDGDPEEGEGATKAMVFVTYRTAVDEIVAMLNEEQPLIRATAFIGQGTDKKGKKGLAQREQLEVIQRFKNNEFNVLVATSVGEEGLDIGEVDLAVLYDTQKTPIRMLQRLGRTGRKRSGHVHALLADGREELNFDKAKSTYDDVLASIMHGSHLEFYADVKRLLPDNVHPQCLEKEMEIHPYVREVGRRKRAQGDDQPKKGVKRKRNDDMGRNIPQGASTGFVSVADLIAKGKKKAKKTRVPKDFEALGEDDSDDLDIAAGVAPLLKKSKSAADPKPKASTSTLRKSKTLDPNKAKGKKRKGKEKNEPPVSEWTTSQLLAKGDDDSDDMLIENGIFPKKPAIPNSSPRRGSSDQAIVDGDVGVIDLTDSDSDHGDDFSDFEQPFESPGRRKSPSQSPQMNGEVELSWQSDDDNVLVFELDSSPVVDKTKRSPVLDNSIMELDNDFAASPSRSTHNSSPGRMLIGDLEPVEDELSPPPPSQIRNRSWFSSEQREKTRAPSPPYKSTHRTDMPPPALPARFTASSPISVIESPQAPEPTFAPRLAGITGTKRIAGPLPRSSPADESPSQAPRRLRRRRDSSEADMEPSPARKRSKEKHKKRPIIPLKHNPLFEYAAEHSGDEVSEGSSGSEDVESESDRLFVEEFPETQVSPSYDQTLAYRRSLMTQAPSGAPTFANKPMRRGPFGRNSMSGNQRREGVSSSPPRDDDEPDAYEFGSFVVDDDADISYEI